jgi:hypothetical protein
MVDVALFAAYTVARVFSMMLIKICLPVAKAAWQNDTALLGLGRHPNPAIGLPIKTGARE